MVGAVLDVLRCRIPRDYQEEMISGQLETAGVACGRGLWASPETGLQEERPWADGWRWGGKHRANYQEREGSLGGGKVALGTQGATCCRCGPIPFS